MPEPTPSPDGLTALLHPRSVAVLGASAKRTASGNHVLRNLLNMGYSGDVFAVHPAAPVIEGLQAVAGVGDLPHGVDAAVLSLPSAYLLDALHQLEAAGCRAALIPTVGLGRPTSRAVGEFAAHSPMAVHGPNCMGLINLTDGVPLWIDTAALAAQPAGTVALISQSGSAALFIARSAGPTRFSKIVSTGDELGATTADYLSWLAEDPATTAAGVVVESIRDVPAFAAAVARMRRAGKPVVVPGRLRRDHRPHRRADRQQRRLPGAVREPGPAGGGRLRRDGRRAPVPGDSGAAAGIGRARRGGHHLRRPGRAGRGSRRGAGRAHTGIHRADAQPPGRGNARRPGAQPL